MGARWGSSSGLKRWASWGTVALVAAGMLVGVAEGKTTCNLQCDCEGVNGTTVAEAGGLQVIIGGVVLAETVLVCDEVYECPGCQACRQRCDCTAPVPYCAGTCLKFPGFVCNDPHVRGFDGTAFDLQGDDGASYAIVSAPGLALNARVWRPDEDSSFVDGVGLVWLDPASGEKHTLAVGIEAEAAEGYAGGMSVGVGHELKGVTFEPGPSGSSAEHTSVVLDGVRLGVDSGVYRAFDGLLEVEADGDAEAPTVRVSLPNLEVVVMHSKLQSPNKQHFDLSVTHFLNPCGGDEGTAHGLLGQTLAEGESEFVAKGGRRSLLEDDGPRERTPLGLAELAGQWEDEYQTDGLFGTSFAFSRFLSTCDRGTVSV